MASIPPTAANNPILAGLQATLPNPHDYYTIAQPGIAGGGAGITGSGMTFGAEGNNLVFGGDANPGIRIVDMGAQPAAPGDQLTRPATPPATGAADGGAPALDGADQPAAPTGTGEGVAPGTTVAGAGTNAGTATDTPLSPASTERAAGKLPGFTAGGTQRLAAGVGGATFSFPSWKGTNGLLTAPKVDWGEGWERVDAGGGKYYMEHANGAKAVPSIEWRITGKPWGSLKTISYENGWGKELPDGTKIYFDRDSGPFKVAPDGTRSDLEAGNYKFGDVPVRIFSVSVVRTLEPNGMVTVFDSRGNVKNGTTRSAAAAGATGGGKLAGGKGDAPGKLAGGGGMDPAALQETISGLTDVVRGLLAQAQAGEVDPAELASLSAEISSLTASLQGAVGGAGMLAGDAGPGVADAAGGGDGADPVMSLFGAYGQPGILGDRTVAGGGGDGGPGTPGIDGPREVLAPGTGFSVYGLGRHAEGTMQWSELPASVITPQSVKAPVTSTSAAAPVVGQRLLSVLRRTISLEILDST